MRKSESYRTLFELARRSPYEAEAVSALIRGEDLDLIIMLKYSKYDYVKNIRVLASNLAKRIPPNILNLEILIVSQRSQDDRVRILARDLALKIKPGDIDCQILKKYMESENERVDLLVDKLSSYYRDTTLFVSVSPSSGPISG